MTSLVHDPLTRFVAQVLAIVIVSRLLGLVMRRLSQPLVIAEVVAGILLGPSLLGWVAPDLSATVFAPSSRACVTSSIASCRRRAPRRRGRRA